MIKVLNDIKVLEMGTFITGPAAGMAAGRPGADVVKIEHPEGGDPFRAFNGEFYSPHFQTYNRNKAQQSPSTPRRRKTWPSSTGWRPRRTCSSRTSAPARPSG